MSISAIKIDEKGWEIIISGGGSKKHTNPSKLNYKQKSNKCLYVNCPNPIRRNRMSGLCDEHSNHADDLVLTIRRPGREAASVPTHEEIIDKLLLWNQPRRYDLDGFFQALSFGFLGSIPDVTTLAQKIHHEDVDIPNLNTIKRMIFHMAERYFPQTNTSSYQLLETKKGNYPVRVLAIVFVGLICCEEANRGDRWFCRNVMKDESKVSKLGGAFPLAYYAVRSFSWGVDLGRTAHIILNKY